MTSWRRRRKRFADSVLRHKTAVATGLVCLAVGVALGWIAGSYTVCNDTGCQKNVDAIEAAGTWAGGLGTMAAVIIAAAALRSDERIREQEDAEDEAFELAEAGRVRINMPSASRQDVYITGISMSVTNRTYEFAVFDLKADVEGYGEFSRPHELPRGDSVNHEFGWPRQASLQIVAPTNEEEKRVLADVKAKTTITFTLANKPWRRTGDGPAELVETEDTTAGTDQQ